MAVGPETRKASELTQVLHFTATLLLAHGNANQ
jgi:hypothetical protein